MTHLAVVAWTADNRVAKYQDYATKTEASAHVRRVSARYPSAFVAPDPGGGFADWRVDTVAKMLSIDPAPTQPRIPTDMEIVRALLIDKAVITQADWDAKTVALRRVRDA